MAGPGGRRLSTGQCSELRGRRGRAGLPSPGPGSVAPPEPASDPSPSSQLPSQTSTPGFWPDPPQVSAPPPANTALETPRASREGGVSQERIYLPGERGARTAQGRSVPPSLKRTHSDRDDSFAGRERVLLAFTLTGPQ